MARCMQQLNNFSANFDIKRALGIKYFKCEWFSKTLWSFQQKKIEFNQEKINFIDRTFRIVHFFDRFSNKFNEMLLMETEIAMCKFKKTNKLIGCFIEMFIVAQSLIANLKVS